MLKHIERKYHDFFLIPPLLESFWRETFIFFEVGLSFFFFHFLLLGDIISRFNPLDVINICCRNF